MVPQEQAIELIKKYSTIGIALAENPTLDAAAAFFALKHALAAEKKNVGSIFSGTMPEKIFSVFPPKPTGKDELLPCTDCIITIADNAPPLKEIRYEKTAQGVDIIVTPKNQPITEEHISVRRGNPKYDLIITLGAPSLESLGTAFKNSPDLFCEKPIIAISRVFLHEPFAEVTLADKEKSSVSEIIADLLFALAPERMTRDTATALFFGMAEATNNFETSRLKPSTIAVAKKLLKNGADKTRIPRPEKNLAPTAPLIQLAGRALVRSRAENSDMHVWSLLTAEDFLKTGVSPDAGMAYVLDQLMGHYTDARTMAFLWQDPLTQAVSAAVKANPPEALRAASRPHAKPGWWQIRDIFPTFLAAEEEIKKLLGNQEKK